jgi:hypothetical protein
MTTEGLVDLADPHERLRAVVRDRIRALLAANGVPSGMVRCTTQDDGPALHIHLDVPAPLSQHARQAVVVRVHDAVRATGPTYGSVDVHVHTSAS